MVFGLFQGESSVSLGLANNTLYTTTSNTWQDGDAGEEVDDYGMMAETDDIYKVPGSNQPVNASDLPEGVLFMVT